MNAGGNKTINIGQGIVLNATVTGNASTFAWSPPTGLNNSSILNPVASPASTVTYTLMVQSAEGCIGTDSATVEVQLPLLYPIPLPLTAMASMIHGKLNTSTPIKIAACAFLRAGGK